MNAEVCLQPVVPAAQHRQLSRSQAALFPVRKCSFYVNYLTMERLSFNEEMTVLSMKYQFLSFFLSLPLDQLFVSVSFKNRNTNLLKIY
jgi:hypothetical protein